jgi:nucleoside-diphosphate-sugar epimerase
MLPMMYMPDCIKAIVDLAEASFSSLRHHCDFNVAGFSVTPALLAVEIRKHLPGIEVTYQPDFRQAIADSWPYSIDDSAAREEWGWQPATICATARDMIERLSLRHELGQL